MGETWSQVKNVTLKLGSWDLNCDIITVYIGRSARNLLLNSMMKLTEKKKLVTKVKLMFRLNKMQVLEVKYLKAKTVGKECHEELGCHVCTVSVSFMLLAPPRRPEGSASQHRPQLGCKQRAGHHDSFWESGSNHALNNTTSTSESLNVSFTWAYTFLFIPYPSWELDLDFCHLSRKCLN